MDFRPIALMAILPLCVGCGAVEITEDFSDYPDGSTGGERWYCTSFPWEVRDGAFQFDGPKSFAYLRQQPPYKNIDMEATVRLNGSSGNSWKVAGVCIYLDKGNFWHVALVEAPEGEDGRHFWELCEMRDGQWLAQNNLKTVRDTGRDVDWQYGKAYRLRIALTPDAIQGQVFDGGGNKLAEREIKFTADAVKSGRPALHASQFSGSFDDISITASKPAPQAKAKLEKQTIPPYNVETSQLPKGEATGFFHTVKRGRRWWVIDPEGRPFYAVGTDHCRYDGHWCQDLGYAPYRKKNDAKWDSKEAWAQRATKRLRAWGFNLLGAGHGDECRYKGLAHTAFLRFGTNFADYSDICPKVDWTGFPNVFSPKWPAYCDKRARQMCSKQRRDPWLFGYFLDNELEWYGKSHTEWGLFDETMKKPADHSGKKALVEFLKDKYPSIAEFNDAWGADIEAFDDILKLQALGGDNIETVRQDKTDFTRLVAERYFKYTTEAMRKYDANHLILGCRFAARAPAGIWEIAGRYCDIVTFNYYGRVDLQKGTAPDHVETFTDYYEQAGRPLMITEWSFPALDSGLPCKHGAGMRVDTQKQKAECFRIYQQMFFRLPFFVGSDYFMWVDEPKLGISESFPEDSNYGLVDVNDRPYEELTQMATRVNENVYELHSGQYVDLGVREPNVVFNDGRAEQNFTLRVIVDGNVTDRQMTLKPGQETELDLPKRRRPGAHLIVIQADPGRRTADPDPTNNRLVRRIWSDGLQVPRQFAKAPTQFLAVGNHSDVNLKAAAGIVRQLPRRLLYSRVNYMPQVYNLQKEAVPSQLVDDELLVSVGDMAPWSCRTCLLVWHNRDTRPRPEGTAVNVVRENRRRIIDNGIMRLTVPPKDSGDVLNPIAIGDTQLGRYNPLIWQEVGGQDQWVRTDNSAADISVGPVGAVIHATARGGAEDAMTAVDDDGEYAKQSGKPVRFEVAHDVFVYPDKSWFLARLDYIKNISSRPLTIKGYFFYLPSFIGGDPENDIPAGPDVPNYYGIAGGCWEDATAGYVFGAIPADENIKAHFWLNESGGQHADARRELPTPQTLKPDEKYTDDAQPLLFVYGAKADDSVQQHKKRRAKAVGELNIEVRNPQAQ